MAKSREESASSKQLNEGIKNFRMSDDIQNFLRFIHENDLRKEALMLLEATTVKTKKRSRKKKIQ